MLKTIRNIAIFLGILLIIIFTYDAFYKNTAIEWHNFKKPELASFVSLEEDQKILTELRRQTIFGSYKPLDPRYFVKANIFKVVEKR